MTLDGMDEDPVVARTFFESLACVDVFGSFGHVYVDADVELLRERTHGVECFVREREARMGAHIAASSGLEVALVLGKTRFGFVATVSVSDFVTGREANADLSARICNDGQGSFDGAR